MNEDKEKPSLLLDFSDKQFQVTIVLNKQNRPDFLLIDLQTRTAKSNRSPTELINNLLSQNAHIDIIDSVITFINTTMKNLQVQCNGKLPS